MIIIQFIIHLVSRLRLLLYKCKIFKTHSFDMPIISVGNIQSGGAGKTPMVAFLVKELESRNKKVCVVGDSKTDHLYKSVRNIKDISYCTPEKLNTEDILKREFLVVTEKAIDKVTDRVGMGA